MGELDETAVAPHEQAGAEGPQGEVVDVDPAADRRVGRVEHLEAAVEEEPVDLVGALPTPDDRLALEQDARRPASASRSAHRRPASPAPMTMTSASTLAP